MPIAARKQKPPAAPTPMPTLAPIDSPEDVWPFVDAPAEADPVELTVGPLVTPPDVELVGTTCGAGGVVSV